MDSMFRSPVHSTFAMLVDGVITLRAYEKNEFFSIDFLRNLEKGANVTFMNHVANRWLGIRIDFVIFMFCTATAALAVASKGLIPVELLTFTLQNITDVVPMVSISVRLYAEFENYMTSSQRIYEYTQLEPEDELEKAIDSKLKE